MLLQKDSHHKLVPVAYESRKLMGPEQNFNQCMRECLVAVWAVQKFEGLAEMAPVGIQTHHSPLKYILSGKLAGSKHVQHQDFSVGIVPNRTRGWT